jgi:hypothetical protein
MSYKVIDGKYLYTGGDDAPKVQVLTRSAGNPTDLVIEYVSLDGLARTKITFPSVFEYRWVDSDWNRVWPHPEDYEFGLIEIVNSEFVDRMIESSPYRSHPPGERLGGVLKEADVHHYRLGFADHGIYDIVSVMCVIETIFTE